MAIVVNKPLPEFEANATGGIKVSNTSHLGQILVLYFYPKDNTPGCTTEAMQFRDKYKDFVKAGAAVFGVSRDNMKSHDDFKEKLELPFELIADTEEKMCHMFGVVKNKIMYGKKVKGIERSTFLIGPDGLLVQEWRGLKVPGHVDEVLKTVKSLKALKKAARADNLIASAPATVAIHQRALEHPRDTPPVLPWQDTWSGHNGSMPLVLAPLAPIPKAALASRRLFAF